MTRRAALLSSIFIATFAVFLGLGGKSTAAENEAKEASSAVTSVSAEAIATPEPAPKAADAAKPPKVSIGARGFKVQSADGRYMFDVGGRVQVDGTGNIGTVELTSDTNSQYYYADGAAPIDGAELRRARIETAARAGDFPFVGEVDFASDDVGVKDFWVGYDGLSWLRVMVGNQKQPYSLEVEESSNDISYMERGIDSFLITPFVDRAIGARGDTWGPHHYIAVGVYGDGVSPDNNTDDGWGTAGRFIYSPIVNDETVLHLGFRVAYRQPGNDDEQEVRIQDETTHMSSLSIVDTGAIDGVHAVTLFGPEAAFAHRFFKLAAEYNYVHFQPEAGSPVTSDFDFQSAYVSLSIPLNGQRWAKAYRMSAGEFKHLENVHDFNPKKGHWGEFELAGRWAFIDLNDGPITGGREQAFSTALNWQLNYNVRMMFDWTYILKTEGPANNDPTNSSTQGLNIIGARAQFAF